MAYSDLPSPSTVGGKFQFTVPGTVAGTLSVRRKALIGGVPGNAATAPVPAYSGGAPEPKNQWNVFIGNSIFKGDYNDLVEYIYAGQNSYLTSIDAPFTVAGFDNLAVNGTTNSTINANFTTAYSAQPKSVDAAIRAALEAGYEVNVFLEENFNDGRHPYETRTAAQVHDQALQIVAKIKAISAEVNVFVNTPGPDRLSEYDPSTDYPTRPDWAAFQEQLAALTVADAAPGGVRSYYVYDRARDTIYSAEKPTQSIDGVHPNQVAVTDYYVGQRPIDAWKECHFNIPQPARVLPPNANYASGASAVTYPTQVNQSIQDGVITSKSTVSGYGATGLSTLKMPAGAASFGMRVLAGSRDAIMGVNTDNLRVGYADMEVAMWVNSADDKLWVKDGSTLAATTLSPADGSFVFIARAVGGAMKIIYSTDGAAFSDVQNLSFASTADLFLVADIERFGKLSYPQGIGLVPASADTDTKYLPGASAFYFYSDRVLMNNGRLVATTGRPYGAYGGAAKANMVLNGNGILWFKIAQADSFDAILALKEVNDVTPDASGNVYTSARVALWVSSYDPTNQGLKHMAMWDNGTVTVTTREPANAEFYGIRRTGSAFDLVYTPDNGATITHLADFTYQSAAPMYAFCDVSGPGVMYYPQGVGFTAV